MKIFLGLVKAGMKARPPMDAFTTLTPEKMKKFVAYEAAKEKFVKNFWKFVGDAVFWALTWPLGIISQGYVLKRLLEILVIPVFPHAPDLRLGQAYAVATFVRFVTYQMSWAQQDPKTKFKGKIGAALFWPWLMLFFVKLIVPYLGL
jgi:hypothetical protein